jgi:hypothetical protein
MPHLAASILASHLLSGDAQDRRREDAWRELHRRPDALPDAVEPVRPSRRFRVTGISLRLHRPATGEG